MWQGDGLTVWAVTFLAPARLWTLLALLALAGGYVAMQLRRKRYTVRFTNLPLLDQVAPRRPGWRRHVPATLFLLALAVMMLAWARPAGSVRVPVDRATIVIAIDVSPSMKAKDVPPSRLAAEKVAAKKFVTMLPPRFNVGVVAFGGYAETEQQPTQNHPSAKRAIDSLTYISSTAIGEGVFKSLTDIQSLDDKARTDPPPSAIVLLSDGENTVGRPISDAIAAAKEAKVPVSTIAYGTDNGTIVQDGHRLRVKVDPAELKNLADGTGGHAYRAASTGQLNKVYSDIGTSLGYRTVHREITSRFVGIDLLLAVAAAVFSLAWFQRLP